MGISKKLACPFGVYLGVFGTRHFAFKGGRVGVFIGAAMAGFGMAGIYPTTFAIFTEQMGEMAHQMAGYFSVFSNLGGMFIPWLGGYTSYAFDDLRLEMKVPLRGALVMIGLQLAVISVLVQNGPGRLSNWKDPSSKKSFPARVMGNSKKTKRL